MVCIQRRRESNESSVSIRASVSKPKHDISVLLRHQGSEVPAGSPDFSLYSSDALVEAPTPSRGQRRPTYTFEKTKRVQVLLWRALYITIAFMWIGGYRQYHSSVSFHEELLQVLENDEQRTSSTHSSLQKFQLQVRNLQGQLSQMSTMNHAFQHELRMVQEMADEQVDMHMTESKMSEAGTVTNWIRQRKRGLEHRVHVLKTQVQELSKQSVLEKWGPGPHYVKFKVHVLYSPEDKRDNSEPIKSTGVRLKKDFVVELAPLNIMPHSVYLFLELVSSKLWDNTVFLHNDQSKHVMAVAPLDYVSHNLKVHDLDAVSNFSRLGFPEYSTEYPHSKYTLGFSDKGPTFYVNTMDNNQHHGPGGQDHFLLQGDADPCFGTVVEGREVIDMLVSSGAKASNRLNPRASHPWQDRHDMHFTRIISLDIQNR